MILSMSILDSIFNVIISAYFLLHDCIFIVFLAHRHIVSLTLAYAPKTQEYSNEHLFIKTYLVLNIDILF